MKERKSCVRLLIVLFVFTMLLTGNCTASAADDGKIPSKLHIQVKNRVEYWYKLPGVGYSIKNLKSSSKNLIVKKTYEYHYKNDKSKSNSAQFNLGFYAKKNGTYKVRFDIVNPSGKKVESKKISVKADNYKVIKNIKLDDVPYNYYKLGSSKYTFKEKVKVYVKLNKGYQFKEFQVANFNYNTGKENIKKYNNGAKISLPKQYTRKEIDGDPNGSYYYRDISDEISSNTWVSIIYKDLYTGETENTGISLVRIIG